MSSSPVDDRSSVFVRAAAIAAIVSLPVAVASFVVGLLAVDFRMDAYTDPLLVLSTGANGATLWRWSMILDMLGYYLLIVPIIVVLAHGLPSKDRARSDLFILCLLAYCLIGAAGAATLAGTQPSLITAWESAASPERAMLEVVFLNQTKMVYGGLWNLLDALLAGVGWVGLGLALSRNGLRIGSVTIALGAASLLDGIGTMFMIEPVQMAGLFVYLVLAPVWACWLGLAALGHRFNGARAHVTSP